MQLQMAGSFVHYVKTDDIFESVGSLNVVNKDPAVAG